MSPPPSGNFAPGDYPSGPARKRSRARAAASQGHAAVAAGPSQVVSAIASLVRRGTVIGFVLVHGGYGGAWNWDEVVPLLDAPAVAVDLPGRGGLPTAERI